MKIIEVVAKANANRREIKEGPDGRLIVRTTRPPEKGQANRDIIDQLSNYLGIAKSRIEIIGGKSHSFKKFRVD